MTITETLDISQVLANISAICKAERPPTGSRGPRHEMGKSLDHYESAMGAFDRLVIFKNLWTALELAANSGQREDMPASNLEAEISSVSGTPQSEIKKWRDLNNRTKHLDRSPNHASEFVQGMEELPTYLELLRTTAKKLILSRLSGLP